MRDFTNHDLLRLLLKYKPACPPQPRVSRWPHVAELRSDVLLMLCTGSRSQFPNRKLLYAHGARARGSRELDSRCLTGETERRGREGFGKVRAVLAAASLCGSYGDELRAQPPGAHRRECRAPEKATGGPARGHVVRPGPPHSGQVRPPQRRPAAPVDDVTVLSRFIFSLVFLIGGLCANIRT